MMMPSRAKYVRGMTGESLSFLNYKFILFVKAVDLFLELIYNYDKNNVAIFY